MIFALLALKLKNTHSVDTTNKSIIYFSAIKITERTIGILTFFTKMQHEMIETKAAY